MSSHSILPEHQFLINGDYVAAVEHYEMAIADEPEVWSHYWYLGLCLLLQGQEFEAQAIWYGAMAEQKDIESWTEGLTHTLQHAVQQQHIQQNVGNLWLIRRYLHELWPENINNLLHLVLLAKDLDKSLTTELIDLDVIEHLEKKATLILEQQTDNPEVEIDPEILFSLLSQTFQQYLSHSVTNDLADVATRILKPSHQLFEILLVNAIRLAYDFRELPRAIHLAQLCLRLNLNNAEVLRHLAPFYQNAQQYHEGIETARQCYQLSSTIPDQVFANHLLLRGLTTAGHFGVEVSEACDRHHQLIQALMKQYPTDLAPPRVLRLFNSLYELPYLADHPLQFRTLQNQLAQLCQANIERYSSHSINQDFINQDSTNKEVDKFNLKIASDQRKSLKVGYLSHCLGRHSVGWLARWLIQYHDRDRFHINGYFQGYRQGMDSLQEWYREQFSESRIVSNNSIQIAQQIQDDEIDILVDLDSITLDITCEVMALKPAPVQVTWLGWDASGVPGIDYFIADPYVLPNNAQEYYQEKIWRLPQTYIAVDGFEIGVPTLRREHLSIPADAIIYFSSQRGFKRHPDTVRLQMQILKNVKNSYFLIKGKADEHMMLQFFHALADEINISRDRIKFLPWAESESEHRANIAIADVVLDTYPYNGATTTLETLWMGIPLVTRVGQQFAARNSYTMMINAGITEGVAWTDEEYVEWGIRLGTDTALRQQVAWKLRQSRQTAPLWNAQQFTREMENAYQQMWSMHMETL